MISTLATIGLVASILAILAPAAGAVTNTCRAKNMTQGRPSNSDLQAVIAAADPGDRIAVRYVCVGNFKISKELTLLGKATTEVHKPILTANGSGRTLFVDYKRVTLTNLVITGGHKFGGIANSGILRLNDTVVRRNHAGGYGGGIFNAGALILNGSSSVRKNTGGGIFNDEASLTLNDSSSVSRNTGGGIGTTSGSIILNDSSSVRGNQAGTSGGGILVGTFGSVTLNDSSSVRGNTAKRHGAGIMSPFRGAVTLNDSSWVSGNTADADDAHGGTGGGIFVGCLSTLTGAVDGGNVYDNFRGAATPVEDNIFLQPC